MANPHCKQRKIARARSPATEREAEAEAPERKRRKTSADGRGKWAKVDKISYIRRTATSTQDNQGFEYLVHWSLPCYRPSWTPACEIMTSAVHEFWINNYQNLTIKTAGYEPSTPTTPILASSPAADTAELSISLNAAIRDNESHDFNIGGNDNRNTSDDDVPAATQYGEKEGENESKRNDDVEEKKKKNYAGYGLNKCTVS